MAQNFTARGKTYITTMELTLENSGATQAIKELLNMYLVAVYGIPYHNTLNFHLIFHPYSSDYDYLQKPPAFVLLIHLLSTDGRESGLVLMKMTGH